MKIAQGLQFQVYDRGDQVEKIATSPCQMLWTMICMRPAQMLRFWNIKADLGRAQTKRDKILAELKTRKVAPYLLGNISFRENSIFQNKLPTISEYLAQSKNPEQVIEKIIDCIFSCWQNGFLEQTFNFTNNYGMDQTGKVVVLDIGEITFSKSAALKSIQGRKWEQSWSFKKDLPKDIRNYWLEEMGKRVTVKALNKNWRDGRDLNPRPPA